MTAEYYAKKISVSDYLYKNTTFTLGELCSLISDEQLTAFAGFPYSMLPVEFQESLKEKNDNTELASYANEHEFIFGIGYCEPHDDSKLIVACLVDSKAKNHKLPQPLLFDIRDVSIDTESAIKFEQSQGINGRVKTEKIDEVKQEVAKPHLFGHPENTATQKRYARLLSRRQLVSEIYQEKVKSKPNQTLEYWGKVISKELKKEHLLKKGVSERTVKRDLKALFPDIFNKK